MFAITMGAAVAVPLAMPAGAAPKASGACATESSPPLNAPKAAAHSTFANCTPAAVKAGGTGATLKTPPPGTKKGSVNLKITWKGGKGTTTITLNFGPGPKKNTCAKGTVLLSASGKVVSGTGAAKTIFKAGEPVKALTCVVTSGKNQGKSSLEKGTKFTL